MNYNIPVIELDLSIRLLNVLKRNGIFFLSDIKNIDNVKWLDKRTKDELLLALKNS